MTEIVQMIGGFGGNGFLLLLYLIALIYLFLTKQNKACRLLFVYVPLLVLLIFMNPILAKLFTTYADAEIYYRLLWLLPTSVTIAYAIIHLLQHTEAKKQLVTGVVCLLLVLFCGKCIYLDSNMRKAENIYHVPNAVVDICDAVVIEGREVMVAFPSELLQYVRQYTPLICMPYGRENLVGKWDYGYHPLSSALNQEIVEAAKLGPLANEYMCHYLVLRGSTEIVGDLSEFGFVYDRTIDGYQLYRSVSADFGM